MQISKKKIKEFNNKGYCIVKIGYKNQLANLRRKLLKMINNIASEMHGINIRNDKDLIKLEKSKYRKVFVAVFDLLHLDPEVYRLSSIEKIIQLEKKLSIKYPHHGTRPLVRVDFPNYKKYSYFKTHQDFPYNNHSINSVTVWIPLQNTGVKEGSLEVSPGTHKEKKIFI